MESRWRILDPSIDLGLGLVKYLEPKWNGSETPDGLLLFGGVGLNTWGFEKVSREELLSFLETEPGYVGLVSFIIRSAFNKRLSPLYCIKFPIPLHVEIIFEQFSRRERTSVGFSQESLLEWFRVALFTDTGVTGSLRIGESVYYVREFDERCLPDEEALDNILEHKAGAKYPGTLIETVLYIVKSVVQDRVQYFKITYSSLGTPISNQRILDTVRPVSKDILLASAIIRDIDFLSKKVGIREMSLSIYVGERWFRKRDGKEINTCFDSSVSCNRFHRNMLGKRPSIFSIKEIDGIGGTVYSMELEYLTMDGRDTISASQARSIVSLLFL